MIRPFTCICMLLAAGAGLYLYQTKHRAQLLDREIAHTYKQIEQTKDRIGVLKGEWALLNEPERLADLARQHLILRTLAPTQFVAMADLGNHLPAPLAPGAFVAPLLEGPPVPSIAVPVPAQPASVASTAIKPALAANLARSAPVQIAAIPPSAIPSSPTSRPPPRASAPVATTPVTTTPVATSLSTAAPPAAPPLPSAPRFMAPVVNVSASPVPSQHPAPATNPASPVPARYTAVATAAPSTIPPAAPLFGSVLGSVGHVALPAPVPYATSASR